MRAAARRIAPKPIARHSPIVAPKAARVSRNAMRGAATGLMHKAVGLDGRRDPQRVLKVLQEIDADVVALQEADKRVGGRGSTVPHELIDSHGMIPMSKRAK